MSATSLRRRRSLLAQRPLVIQRVFSILLAALIVAPPPAWGSLSDGSTLAIDRGSRGLAGAITRSLKNGVPAYDDAIDTFGFNGDSLVSLLAGEDR